MLCRSAVNTCARTAPTRSAARSSPDRADRCHASMPRTSMERQSDLPRSDHGNPERSSPFSSLIGPIEVTWDPSPVFETVVRQDSSNTIGRVHGGFLAALVDITTGQGTKRILDDGRSLVTATTTTEYLGPARVGDRLRVEVAVDHSASSLVFVPVQSRPRIDWWSSHRWCSPLGQERPRRSRPGCWYRSPRTRPEHRCKQLARPIEIGTSDRSPTSGQRLGAAHIGGFELRL